MRDSAGMRWTALLLLALAMFCAYIFMDILSPIKDYMESTRGWDSSSFGRMQGAEVFLNVYVFFLIFAGIILDKMGVRFTAVLSGAVMLIGGIISWFVSTRSKDEKLNKARMDKGTLIASGFIAGGALMGVVSAAMKFGGFKYENPLSDGFSSILGLVVYIALIIYFAVSCLRAKKTE